MSCRQYLRRASLNTFINRSYGFGPILIHQLSRFFRPKRLVSLRPGGPNARVEGNVWIRPPAGTPPPLPPPSVQVVKWTEADLAVYEDHRIADLVPLRDPQSRVIAFTFDVAEFMHARTVRELSSPSERLKIRLRP